MKTTLTRRYIDQVVAHVPEGQREDISRELDALTSDMLEERLDGGALEDSAEREVLEELGDPARLAARYRGAPNYLIGPDIFPLYARLLRWALVLVPLIALLANIIVYSATVPDGRLGGMIGQAVGGAVVALLIAFGAVTGIFAVFERVAPSRERGRAGRSAERTWSVEDLDPEVTYARDARSEAISGLVFLGIAALLPLVPTTFLYVGHLNGGGSFVNQALWDFWLPAFYLLLLLAAARAVWAIVQSRVTRWQLVFRAALDVVTAAFLTALVLTQDVLDPAIDSGILQTSSGADWVDMLYVAVIWLVALWDLSVVLRFWRTRPASSGAEHDSEDNHR